MNKLYKSRSVGSITRENHKYYVECDEIDTPNRLQIIQLLKEQHDEDSNETDGKINVVVKMGKSNATIQNEYNISLILCAKECPGFIQFRCLFSCYDKPGKQQNSREICKQNATTGIKRDVLIMNYIPGGSIEAHAWSESNFHILRSLLIQSIFSCVLAYERTGFIHYDLHLGNILIKRTKHTTSEYEINGQIYETPTNNYLPIIMDYAEGCQVSADADCLPWENCTVSKERMPPHNHFWDSIDNTINRVKYDLKTKNKDFIKTNLDNVSRFILQNKNKDYLKALDIVPMIESAEFWVKCLERRPS